MQPSDDHQEILSPLRTHTHTHTHAHACAQTHTHARTCAHTYARTHARAHAHERARTHAHIRMHTHACTHTRMHAHAHTHAHTHTPWGVITRHTPFQFSSWGKIGSLEWMKLGKYETSSDEGAQPSQQWGERTSGHGAGVEDRCERHSGSPCAGHAVQCAFMQHCVRWAQHWVEADGFTLILQMRKLTSEMLSNRPKAQRSRWQSPDTNLDVSDSSIL